MGASAGGRGLVRTLHLGTPAWLRSCDKPLQVTIKALAAYPEARLAVFAYAVILHVWVFIVFSMSMASPAEPDYVGSQAGLLLDSGAELDQPVVAARPEMSSVANATLASP